jgi:hypothetical protein
MVPMEKIRPPVTAAVDLRDYFAAAALQGLMSTAIDDDVIPAMAPTWAYRAYALADAMLAARTQEKEET